MFGRKMPAKNTSEFPMPEYANEGDAGFDLRITDTVTLHPFERIFQLVVMPYVPCELVPVDELCETDRGAGGFGSTGTE